MSAVGEALTDWSVASAAPGSIAAPDAMLLDSLAWLPAVVPGTVAGALRAAGRWDEDMPEDLDANDWWFRTTFAAAPGEGRLCCDGLATVADVWLNGALVLHSENMFLAHEVPVSLHASNEVVVCCRALAPLLAGRGPRPRWKTRIVEHQRLRGIRTTLLGRMPGWTPAGAAIGPWRPVRWEAGAAAAVQVDRLVASVVDGAPTLELALTVGAAPGPVRVRVAGTDTAVTAVADGGRWRVAATLPVADADLWFPHTHGTPLLHEVVLSVDGADHPLGRVGFRTVTVDTTDDGFALSVNGVPVFCRGACWMPLDAVGLNPTADELDAALRMVVAAGMNMLRLPGTTVPESEGFYARCDALGVLVWQDCTFANMEYPMGDDAFTASVTREVEQLARRLQPHPCLAVLCGGSEVEQQAAMMGVGPGEFPNRLGREIIPAVAARHLPHTPYVPCSPSGGVHPFHVSSGVGHYYGVGAYLRPLEDARRSAVRFASECLAFANVPASETVDELLRDGERAPNAPRWKARVPRDRGAGWDFDDVRDHYVREWFGVDPMRVRYSDPDRYLDLGRAAVVVAMESTLHEFRRTGSTCRGALVLMLRDLWLGAGWGLIDAAGRPKSAYHAVARAGAVRAVGIIDEGLNGLVAHVHNDGPHPLHGTLQLASFGGGGNLLTSVAQSVAVAAHGAAVCSVDALLGAFDDVSAAYRFGPPSYDVLALRLLGEDGRELSAAHFLPGGHARPVEHDIGLRATVEPAEDGADTVTVRVRTERFAQFVALTTPGWVASDDWFHLAPGHERLIEVRRVVDTPDSGWTITALNTSFSTSVARARTDRSQ